MLSTQKKLLERASSANRESAYLDFKSTFDIASAEAWCEVLKDIVAFANTGGGIIVFGADDHGSPLGTDQAPILSLDVADITNRIAKYSGYQFADVEVLEISRDGNQHAAFLIGDAEVPIVFTKPGTYDVGAGKQKTAFSQGSVYFRHGAKSEPGNRDDLLKWRDRAVARVRREWLSGIRKVVDAPEGHTVAVVAPGQLPSLPPGTQARITADPNAPVFIPGNPEDFWPYRQKELLAVVNERLPNGTKINTHDITCVNRKLDTIKTRPDLAFRAHSVASPQYSVAYADFLVAQATKDPDFFSKCREEHRAAAQPPKAK